MDFVSGFPVFGSGEYEEEEYFVAENLHSAIMLLLLPV